MSAPPPVRCEMRERVVVAHLEHGVNALDDELLASLDAELARLAGAGAPPLVLARAHPSIAVLRRLATYPGPTVAAVSGHAIAGGCLLTLACDRRVMARAGARLGLSEINLGIPVPAGAVYLLRTLYPARAVEYLVLDGDGFGGERALELGLVERLAERDAVLGEAVRTAGHLGSRPPRAYAAAKAILREGLGEAMAARDAAELEEFLDLWFDPATQDRIGAQVARLRRR